MNELQARVYKVDFKYIIENCVNRSFWKNAWTVYTCGDFKMTLSLESINTRSNKLVLRLTPNKGYWLDRFVDIPLDKNHYNETVFNNNLKGNMIRLCESVEELEIEKTEEFKKARDLDVDLEEARTQQANDFLDKNSVENDDVREAYIEHYLKQCDDAKFAVNVVKSLKYVVLPEAYLMVCLMFGDEQLRDSILLKNKDHCYSVTHGNLLELIEDAKISFEDMLEDSKKHLSAI